MNNHIFKGVSIRFDSLGGLLLHDHSFDFGHAILDRCRVVEDETAGISAGPGRTPREKLD